MRRWLPIVVVSIVFAACGSKPASSAPVEIRSQYITIARVAADRTNLDITDEDWIEFANLVCTKRILSEEDYDELIEELEFGAPTPELGRAARDVGQSAISLFCPPDL